jgi:DNA-directed RNA polymerase specialized sigma24 family protein
MTRRSIAQLLGFRRDQGHSPDVVDLATARLQAAMENDGEQPPNTQVVAQAASAAQFKGLTAEQEEAVERFAISLPEPQRTMFNLRRNGMSPTDIGKTMGMQSKAVARSLAIVFADLSYLLLSRGG